MNAEFDALVEKAARAMYESDHPAYVASGLTWDHVVATVPKSADTWRRYATAALEAIGLPALLERVEAAEGVLADVWDAGVTAAGGYGHEDGWTHDMSPYLDNPYRAALSGADHGA